MKMTSWSSVIRSDWFSIHVCIFVIVGLGLSTKADECVKSSTSPCICETSQYTIDLTSIGLEGEHAPFYDLPVEGQPDYLYSYSPCITFTEPTTESSDCKGVLACQIDADESNYYNIGEISTYGGDPALGTLYINYTTAEGTRKTNVEVKCDSSTSAEMKGESPEGSGIYYMTLYTELACVGGGGGLSIGSILVILLFVFVVLYLVLGALYLRFVRGAQGWEQVPNYDFWQDFPLLVRDGIVYTINGCKISDTTYEQI